MGIIPEEWKRKKGKAGEEKSGGGRVRRNSIRLSDRGKVIDIVSLLDGDEDAKKEDDQQTIGLASSDLIMSRNVDLDAGAEHRMFSPPGSKVRSGEEQGL